MDVTADGTSSITARRIPGLDGLRTVAVTGVLLFHGGVAYVPGGFLGVDLFFVLSGFLITTLLLEEARARGTVDVVAFWARRARRLLPGLALMSLTTVVVFTGFSSAANATELRGAALAAMLYVANWHFMLDGDGYFDRLDLPSPLQHTWSLSIEEQFYLVWPVILLVAVVLRLPPWGVTTVISVLALSSAAWMAYLDLQGADTDRLYYGSDTRAHTILVGIVTAMVIAGLGDRQRGRRSAPSPRAPNGATVVAGLALAGVVAAMCLVAADDAGLYRGGSLVFSVLCALLVAAVVSSPSGVLTRALELLPVRSAGVLSYSLYLWHWPVFLFLSGSRTTLSGAPLLGARLVTTVVLALASYHLVELPIRRSVRRPRHLVTLPLGAVATCCGLVVAASLAMETFVPRPVAVTVSPAASAPGGEGPLPAHHPDADRPRTPKSTETAPSVTPRGLQVTVLGDSTARSLAAGLRDRAGPGGVVWRNAATLGCGVLPPSSYRYQGVLDPWAKRHCRGTLGRWRHRVAARPADVVAVLVGRWEVADRVVNGRWTHVGEDAFDAFLHTRLRAAVDAAASSDAAVVLLTAPYYSRGEQLDGSSWPEDEPARVDAFNRVLRAAAAEHPGVRVVDLGRRLSGGHRYFVSHLDGIRLRYDGVHLTSAAARWVQPWLEAHVSRAATSHKRPEQASRGRPAGGS